MPRSGDRGSASSSRNSFLVSSRSRGSSVACAWPEIAASPFGVKLFPSTEASCSKPRSSTASASSRAAIRACRVGGMSSSATSPSSSYRSVPAWSTPRSASIRTVSTAYIGTPSARATMRSMSAAGRPRTSPVTSSIIATSGSGSRCNALKLREPEPQFGRRSASSGRASVTIRIGRFLDHSSIDSMKSSIPPSAHWRSSKTITVVPCSAMRSKNVRHAAKSSSRSPLGAASSPSRCASLGSIQRRSSGIRPPTVRRTR